MAVVRGVVGDWAGMGSSEIESQCSIVETDWSALNICIRSSCCLTDGLRLGACMGSGLTAGIACASVRHVGMAWASFGPGGGTG